MTTADQSLNDKIQNLLEEAVKNGVAPGLAAITFNSNEILSEAYAGITSVETNQDWNKDSIFWLASCSKAAVSVVCLQIAKKFNIGLDDYQGLIKYLPELKVENLKILKGWDESKGEEHRKMILEDAKGKVTLKDLLGHTSGFAYAFVDGIVSKATFPEGPNAYPDLVSGDLKALNVPRVVEPGQRWIYGYGVDWAGQMAIRASGQTLRELLNEYVVKPLGISSEELGSFITPGMELKKVAVHAKIDEKTFVAIPFSTPQYENEPPQGFATLASAPLYSTLRAYRLFLAEFLKPFSVLLPPDLFHSVKSDHLASLGLDLPQNPMYSTVVAMQSLGIDYYSRSKSGNEKNLGWTILQTVYEREESLTGRQPGTLSWSGLANSHYFIDSKSNVGGLITAQFLPFGDPLVLNLRNEWEKIIYSHLKCA